MKSLLLIYNPHAGKRAIVHQLHEVVYRFTEEGYEVTVRPTLKQGDATQVAAEEGHRFDRVVCCGGDGTLNEVVTGLMSHPDQMPVLGYLPAGTTNDFSKTLNLSSNLMKAAETALHGEPFACDMGDFNGRTFVYVAAFGAFTEVSYATPQNAKNLLGHLAYVMQGIKSLSQLKPERVRVEYDDQVIEDEFVLGMVTDSVSVGGFQGLKRDNVCLDDGLFEVILVRKPCTMEEFSTILSALFTKEPDGNVIGFRASQITFTAEEPLPWTVDGEFGGDTKVARITNRKQAIRIMRGKEV